MIGFLPHKKLFLSAYTSVGGPICLQNRNSFLLS
jgi:hypothetical protein